MGMNTYLYAPKDDSKHRVFWREQYSVEEAGKLRQRKAEILADENRCVNRSALTPSVEKLRFGLLLQGKRKPIFRLTWKEVFANRRCKC